MTTITPADAADIRRLLPPDLAATLLGQPHPRILADTANWLRERMQAVSRFVPAPIVRHLLAGGTPGAIHGSLWRGSLLFADLSGFTALSERLAGLGKEGSEQITRIINGLFSTLVAEIEIHGGDLIKFGGDALTAFFDADLLGPDHAGWAVRAAQEMQRRMGEIGDVHTRLGVFGLRLRIGVHSGLAFAAMLGDEHHQELMLTGDDVNHVARAQEIARPGEVVCSPAALHGLERIYSVEREDGFAAIQAVSTPEPPGAPVAFDYPPPSGGMDEIRELLRVYAGLRLFLPQRLTEEQLLADEAAGEFRLVTVLFAHVAPFSELIGRLRGDVAAITPLLNLYYARMQRVVTHYGGVVNKLDMAADGDKLLAIFGAPIANEKDSELAVRAGLEMQEAMNEINAILHQAHAQIPLLDQQIGINQGHVFAGLVGSAQRREYTVMGDPVNTAARLMSACPPGDVLVSPIIQRTTKHTFAFQSLPPIALKGKSEPIEPARVDRAYNVRREVMRAAYVGRHAELETLLAQGAEALRGTGRIITVSGEAGIGKSRLLEEALQGLTLASFDPAANIPTFTPISVECQSYEQTTPYASANEVLRQILRLRPGMAENDVVASVISRVEGLVPDLARFTPLLSDVLHLPLPESSLTEALTPEQRHDRALDLIEALVDAAARRTPLVILWDDVNWIDASSRDLIERLARHIATVPLLVLVSLRAESHEPIRWGDHSLTVRLNELDEHDRVALAASILGGATLPAPLLQRWASGDETFFNPQGNPFFIEEMMRGLIEQRVIVQHGEEWVLQGNMDALPTTIEGMITARLDRLETRVRETVQVASVVGRRFQLVILRGLTVGNDLVAQMERLSAADLVLSDHLTADSAFLFKHTLTRDVAYEGILYARRRDLHRRVATRIREIYGDTSDEVLPVLARHYARAEEWAEAVRYYLAAGKQAQNGYFNAEAIAHYSTALELLPNLPAVEAALVIELHERLGYVRTQAGDYPAALESFATALRLLRGAPAHQPEEEARILRHMATAHERRAEYSDAFEHLDRAIELLGDSESAERVRTLLVEAGLHYRQGRYQDTIIWGEQALALAGRLGNVLDQAHAHMLVGTAYRDLGINSKAIPALNQSIGLCRSLNNISILWASYNNLAIIYSDIGNWAKSVELYREAYELTVNINDIYNQALVLLNLGEVYRKMGQAEQAIDNFRNSLGIWQRLGSRLGCAVATMNLGASHLMIAEYAEAERHLDQVRAIFDEIKIENYLPELYRIYAELFFKTNNYTQALDYCDFAIVYAQKLEAKTDEGLIELIRSQILERLQHPARAIDRAQRALTLLEAGDNQQDVLKCLDQLIALTADRDPRLSAEYAARAAAIRARHQPDPNAFEAAS